jgi:hypothetical protein
VLPLSAVRVHVDDLPATVTSSPPKSAWLLSTAPVWRWQAKQSHGDARWFTVNRKVKLPAATCGVSGGHGFAPRLLIWLKCRLNFKPMQHWISKWSRERGASRDRMLFLALPHDPTKINLPGGTLCLGLALTR